MYTLLDLLNECGQTTIRNRESLIRDRYYGKEWVENLEKELEKREDDTSCLITWYMGFLSARIDFCIINTDGCVFKSKLLSIS